MASYLQPTTGLGNGLAPTWYQAITQTIADLLSIRPLETYDPSNALKTL